jgi:TetR/AcrR family fatty acid metabolism transcriptional regulator
VRSKSQPNGQLARAQQPRAPQPAASFIEAARRKQIIGVAIDTIAERGYTQASLAEIAKEVGISKGVISYHFDGKDELIEQVIETLLAASNAYIKARVEAQKTAEARLRAYVEASFEFMQANRNNFVAMVDLWGSFTSAEEKRRFNSSAYEPCRKHLEKLLREGQKDGTLRGIPLTAAAATIQGAIDGIMLQWVFDQNAIDLNECQQTIVQMVRLYCLAGSDKPTARA